MTKNSSITFELTTGNGALPVEGAIVSIYDAKDNYIKSVTTNSSGKTKRIYVSAPSIQNVNQENSKVPYAMYNANIEAEGYLPVMVNGIQVYEGIHSIEALDLTPVPMGGNLGEVVYEIPEPYVEQEGQPLNLDSIPSEQSQTRILANVFIPSTITVHLGSPKNTSAKNVKVSFPYYIKNVASSEIYPTWPESALRANIYAQISFALNRIFTEWYPSRGYNFDITNHTGYDQYFVEGRNIFENISKIVDEVYNEYVKKIGALNPMFTQYCNGTTVTCAGLSQWGTVSLADKGYSPLQILQHYYGKNIQIAETDLIQGIESSYPGYALKQGMSDPAVITLKKELNRVRKNYPLIPAIVNEDAYFDEATTKAVREFQRIFDLGVDGIVGKATWNKLSYIYVAVLKLAELNGEMIPLPENPPSIVITEGSSGPYVLLAQYLLKVISNYYSEVPFVDLTGFFGKQTYEAIKAFQNAFGLVPDGIIGPLTWNRLYRVFLGIGSTTGLAVEYPGKLLTLGSRGDMVWLMQSYLQKISEEFDVPYINADAIFGDATKNAVMAFQKEFGLTPDGIIGPQTWNRIVAVRLLLK